MVNILDGLNPEQRAAVMATEGYYRVIAGAGSGKTRALSHRFAYLVSEVGVLPSAILCATFTNKAASEMKKRIRSLIGDGDTSYIATFHSFCVSVLQEDIHAVRYPKSFMVLDNGDIDQMLKIIYEERGLSLRDMTFGKARDMIEIRKLVKDPKYYELMIALTVQELREKYDSAVTAQDIIFWGYLYQEKKCFGLDYNDLIKYVLHIFEQDIDIRQKWQERLEYVMIDEFQDIDALQYRLMQVLCAYHNNLFIVGDPDQTIYTWRGASVRYLLDFDKEFPNVQTLLMMRNYRSTPEIVASANSLISCNKNRIDKSLLPTLPEGAPVVYNHARTSEEEAQWITGEVLELLAKGHRPGDITILYRAHYLSRVLEEVFIKRELPYTIYSGIQFFGRLEIKDALSYLRLVALRDDLSFLRVANVPKRNLGQRRMKFLEDYVLAHNCSLYRALECTIDDDIFKNTKAKRLLELVARFEALTAELTISELLTQLLDESGYEAQLRTGGSQERLDNLAELKQSVHDFEISCGEEATLESYLAHVALMTASDADDRRDAVKMMTVHTAKGLEFPVVFLCGLMEGVFPSKKVLSQEGMEEERRLCFVALTRAEKRLYLSDAEGRNLDGSYRFPSRFIFNVDRALLHYTNELDARLVTETQLSITQSDLLLEHRAQAPVFTPGDRVTHSIMGPGTLLDLDRDKSAYLIQFDSLPTPRKISMKAKLEREVGT